MYHVTRKVRLVLIVTFILHSVALSSEPTPCPIWAVVTTIHYPTEALKKLNSLSQVHLVVVADKKTPSDWYLEGCDFLSVDKQLSLNYRIIPLIPWNHYSRKNIGYLYAIEHGARIIYDTDDDNIITGDSIEFQPVNTTMNAPSTHSITINPYAYFGQSAIWPRGYPLELILENIKATHSLVPCHPLVQQGLVNNDPDVDAIFRLTRTLPVYFDDNPAICLQHGMMAPFNSQNTIFHYGAFWGLVIPVATAFRVCDIWRGYWVQRILWEIGANLCFLPARVVQERNVHNYMHDFMDETDLYCKAGSLIYFLCNWRSRTNDLFSTIVDLHSSLIDAGFFKPKEFELINAWLEDLHTVGYKLIS